MRRDQVAEITGAAASSFVTKCPYQSGQALWKLIFRLGIDGICLSSTERPSFHCGPKQKLVMADSTVSALACNAPELPEAFDTVGGGGGMDGSAQGGVNERR